MPTKPDTTETVTGKYSRYEEGLDPRDISVQLSELLVATSDATDTLIPGSVQEVLKMVRDKLNMDVVFVSEFVDGQRVIRQVECRGNPPVLSAGQADAPPVLITAPNLIAVREYLRDRPEVRPLIILDGARSFEHQPEILDNLLDGNENPALSFVERMEQEFLLPLVKRDFRGWTWSEGDLREISVLNDPGKSAPESGAFGPLCHALGNFTQHHLDLLVCPDEEIELAAEALHEFLRPLNNRSNSGL